MKPIKIIPANIPQINEELDRVNGRASSFTITSGSDVVYVAFKAEQRLDMLPKADRAGASAVYTPAGPSANAYKYEAKSTRIRIERRSAAWYLVDVQPDTVRPRSSERFDICITPGQAAEIARRAVAEFTVTKPATPETV